MENVTNYSKDLMLELRQDIETKTKEFENHISTIAALINSAGNYWVDSDQDAIKLYEELKSRFENFNAQLDEGRKIMSEFAKTVGGQIDQYKAAETSS